MSDEPKPSEKLGCSGSGTPESEGARLHRQRLLDLGLPAVIDKNAAGEETVYIVLPIKDNFYIDKIGRVDFLHRRTPNSTVLPTPKLSPPLPPPSPESPSDSNAPGRSCSGRSVAQEPPSD